jgi:hypothetical protein
MIGGGAGSGKGLGGPRYCFSMKPTTKLSKLMTLTQFDNGYWYATELKGFAKTIGIPSAGKLRKDELEGAIKLFLRTGKITASPARRLSSSGIKDVEQGLRLDRRVVVYTNDRETKRFLEQQALKRAPGMKRKSGARYRLNRWREAELVRGAKLTYGDLVGEYVRLNRTEGRFAQIPHGRYINFMSDFMAAEKGATRERVLKAWAELKMLDVPKTYQSWVGAKSVARRPRR